MTIMVLTSFYNRGIRLLFSSASRSNNLLSLRHNRPNYNNYYTINSSRIMFSSASSATTTNNNVPWTNTEPSFENRTKPRVLILGSGWGGFTLARRLNKDLFDVRVISPANHFLFTPLLPSTAVGTLEFRAIQEPVRTIKGLGHYYQAKARDIDCTNKIVTCEDLYKGVKFDLAYDYLVVSAGMKSNTFNTPK